MPSLGASAAEDRDGVPASLSPITSNRTAITVASFAISQPLSRDQHHARDQGQQRRQRHRLARLDAHQQPREARRDENRERRARTDLQLSGGTESSRAAPAQSRRKGRGRRAGRRVGRRRARPGSSPRPLSGPRSDRRAATRGGSPAATGEVAPASLTPPRGVGTRRLSLQSSRSPSPCAHDPLPRLRTTGPRTAVGVAHAGSRRRPRLRGSLR